MQISFNQFSELMLKNLSSAVSLKKYQDSVEASPILIYISKILC